jgi:hypothetical protein
LIQYADIRPDLKDGRACASAAFNADARCIRSRNCAEISLVPTLSNTAPMLEDPSPAAGTGSRLPQAPGGRLLNAVSMTLLVVLRVYMVVVAGVVAFRVIVS